MKRNIIIAVAVVALGVGTYTAHGSWFGDSPEKERRIEVQQQLVQQQKDTGSWQGIAFVLGLGCLLTLITGTIIGSKARRDADQSLH